MACTRSGRAVLLGTFCFACFSARGVLGADCYLDKIYTTPDYTQTDMAYGGFPDENGVQHGGVFCGPVAASNGILWLADHGFPNLAPNSGDRKSDQHGVIDTIAGEAYMNAYHNNGAGVNYFCNGLAYYVNDCGYEFERIEAQTWRLVSNHYAPIHTGVNRPELDWARDAIRSPYSAVFWNVGWYTHNADTDVYQREGGHWVTMVGYGHDGAAHDPGYFIIHDPSPRCGMSFRNEYVLPTMITNGTMTGYNPGLPQNAAGYHLLSDWPISSAGNCAILDAVVVLEMLPVSRIPGDTNGDGRVDDLDAKTLAANWGQSGGWYMGDFNNDGVVSALDAAIMAANWGHAVPTEQGNPSTAVPEPTVLVMLACLVFVVGGRYWRVV